MLRGALLLLLMMAGLGVFGCLRAENHLVYRPVRYPAKDYRPPPPPLEDAFLRLADGTKIHARWCPHSDSLDVLLYCHGNAGNLEHRAREVRALWETLGTSVLIFDYPGYGFSEGQPSEAGCYAAAEAAYRWLTDFRHVPPENIIIYGESLGGGVAVDLASRRPCRALVLVRTFAFVPAAAKAPSSATVGPVVQKHFDSLAKIGQCRMPIFLAQADHDRLAPFQQGEQLYAACADRAEFLRLKGLDHNDPLPAEFYTRLRTFLQQRRPAPATGQGQPEGRIRLGSPAAR
jgi:fermentation-respiration switch protein FrsA (DUF1100 family)